MWFRTEQSADSSGEARRRLVIQNLSDQPVTAVEVYLELSTEQYIALHPGFQNAETQDHSRRIQVPVLGVPSLVAPHSIEGVEEIFDPETSSTLRTKYGGVEPIAPTSLPVFEVAPVGVRFTDASGVRRWNRTAEGQLVWENRLFPRGQSVRS